MPPSGQAGPLVGENDKNSAGDWAPGRRPNPGCSRTLYPISQHLCYYDRVGYHKEITDLCPIYCNDDSCCLPSVTSPPKVLLHSKQAEGLAVRRTLGCVPKVREPPRDGNFSRGSSGRRFSRMLHRTLCRKNIRFNTGNEERRGLNFIRSITSTLGSMTTSPTSASSSLVLSFLSMTYV